MRRYNDALDALRFTEEEQEMLIRKLEQAANAAQQPRRRRHPRRVLCIAAAVACALTVTAAAANSLAPILQAYFANSTPAAKQTLAESVLPLDLEQSHGGYTIRLTECIGDDSRLLISGTLTMPEPLDESARPGLNGWKPSWAVASTTHGISMTLKRIRYLLRCHIISIRIFRAQLQRYKLTASTRSTRSAKKAPSLSISNAN